MRPDTCARSAHCALLMPLSSVSTASAMDTDRVTLASTRLHIPKCTHENHTQKNDWRTARIPYAFPVQCKSMNRDRPAVFLPNAFAAEMTIGVDAHSGRHFIIMPFAAAPIF